jgi:hypothetical protein
MRELVMPEWTKHLKDDANFSAKEVLELFGYKKSTGVTGLIRGKLLPPPTAQDGVNGRGSSFGRCKTKRYWSVGLLRKIEAGLYNEE